MGCSAIQKAILIVTEGSNCQVKSRSILYLKGKYRIDVMGGGRGSVLTCNVNLTLSVNKQNFRRPLTCAIQYMCQLIVKWTLALKTHNQLGSFLAVYFCFETVLNCYHDGTRFHTINHSFMLSWRDFAVYVKWREVEHVPAKHSRLVGYGSLNSRKQNG